MKYTFGTSDAMGLELVVSYTKDIAGVDALDSVMEALDRLFSSPKQAYEALGHAVGDHIKTAQLCGAVGITLIEL